MKTESIQARNARVDADKAWETSKTRRATIGALTYLVVVAFLYSINVPNPWLNALVPVVGYLLSTLALPPLKRWWLRNIYTPTGKK